MTDLLLQLEEVKQLIILKHQAGRHDQKKHDPTKGAGSGISIGGSGDAKTPDKADVNALVGKLEKIDPKSIVMTAQMDFDPDVDKILNDGKLTEGSAKYVPMENHLCHRNTAKLYDAGKVDSVVIGYSKNSVTDTWLQHTWGLKEGKVVETTPDNKDNKLYYGLKLSADESKAFSDWAIGNPPGSSSVRKVSKIGKLDKKLEPTGVKRQQHIISDAKAVGAVAGKAPDYNSGRWRINVKVPASGNSFSDMASNLREAGYKSVKSKPDKQIFRNKSDPKLVREVTVSKRAERWEEGYYYNVNASVREDIDLEAIMRELD